MEGERVAYRIRPTRKKRRKEEETKPIVITGKQIRTAIKTYFIICLIGVPFFIAGVGQRHHETSKLEACMTGAYWSHDQIVVPPSCSRR